MSESLFTLPDLDAIPPIGTAVREAHEAAALERGRQLLHESEGHIRDALYALEMELRGNGYERATRKADDVARDYSRRLVTHVEGCWATAVLR